MSSRYPANKDNDVSLPSVYDNITEVSMDGYAVGIIYRATNKISGKMYIGQTKNSLGRRKSEHFRCARSRVNGGKFYKAIRAYLKSDWEWDILLDNVSVMDLDSLEVEFIAKYNTFDSGYNSTRGGKDPYFSKGTKHAELGGENSATSKLKWTSVRRVRDMYMSGKYNLDQLAREFEISSAAVSLIVNNKTWKDASLDTNYFNKVRAAKRKIELGKIKRREDSFFVKLTVGQVEEIRSMYLSGEISQTDLAKKFHMSQAGIGRILNNLVWVDEEYGKCLERVKGIGLKHMSASSKAIRKYDKLPLSDIIILKNEGMSDKEIAKKYGVSRSVINRLLHKKI